MVFFVFFPVSGSLGFHATVGIIAEVAVLSSCQLSTELTTFWSDISSSESILRTKRFLGSMTEASALLFGVSSAVTGLKSESFTGKKTCREKAHSYENDAPPFAQVGPVNQHERPTSLSEASSGGEGLCLFIWPRIGVDALSHSSSREPETTK